MDRFPGRRSAANACAVLVVSMAVLSGCALVGREATVAYLNVNAAFSAKEIEIVINRSFLEKYKDRVEITTHFIVDKAMQNPVSRMFDGDLHVAGRAPEIGFPAVAEIANADSEKEAIALVNNAEGTNVPLKITGVWRIWPEHAESANEIQGMPLAAATSTEPGHIFEIHPVTRINDLKVLNSFRPVEGFLPGDASSTFDNYGNVTCTLTVREHTISLVTAKGLYNDVEFIMEVADEPQVETEGGRFVMAAVRDLKGFMVVERVRMVFAKGTPPEIAVWHLKRGDRLHVCGLPRVNFAEISRRIRDSERDSSLLVGHLPYEMIVVAVYKDTE